MKVQTTTTGVGGSRLVALYSCSVLSSSCVPSYGVSSPRDTMALGTLFFLPLPSHCFQSHVKSFSFPLSTWVLRLSKGNGREVLSPSCCSAYWPHSPEVIPRNAARTLCVGCTLSGVLTFSEDLEYLLMEE